MASSEVVQLVQVAGKPNKLENRDEELRAKHKAYNRAYMQRWRANPRHTSREKLTRRRAYLSRKRRAAPTRPGEYRNLQGELFCGFCRRRRSIMVVSRLKNATADGSRYVEIRMPYCGEC